MASVLDEILEKIKEGVSVIADRTDEYTKIGKLKVEMVNLKRNIEATFTALGGRVYRFLVEDGKIDATEDKEIQGYVEKIKTLEKELTEKKEKIEAVRQQKKDERTERAAEKAKQKEAQAEAKAKPEPEEVIVEVEEEKKEI